MNIEYPLYSDGVIGIKLVAEDEKAEKKLLFNLAIKYLDPGNYRDKNNNIVELTNKMGGETDWFIIPYTFSVVIARHLIEQKSTGLAGFTENGFNKMIEWLTEMEEISDAMCY